MEWWLLRLATWNENHVGSAQTHLLPCLSSTVTSGGMLHGGMPVIQTGQATADARSDLHGIKLVDEKQVVLDLDSSRWRHGGRASWSHLCRDGRAPLTVGGLGTVWER